MARGGKSSSSASSGTRKKHARKAAGPSHLEEPLPVGKEKRPNMKTKEKGKKKEVRQKIYTPPVKPTPIQPDPLDTMGIAHQIPPDLLVVLRRFGKKDTVTKQKALEELQSAWVDRCKKDGDQIPLVSTLIVMLPVWFHHVSALFIHPSRRIRLLAAGLHASLLHISSVRDQIFLFLREIASPNQIENLLGTWSMISHDIDRQIASCAYRSWNESFSLGNSQGKLALDQHLMPHLLSFVQRALLDPIGVYLNLNPMPPVFVAPISKGRPSPALPSKKVDNDQVPRSKVEGEEESEDDRKARMRVGAFGVVQWILDARASSSDSKSIEDLMDLLSTWTLWTSLHHAAASPFIESESFGFNQPNVRKSAWSILRSLLRHWTGVMGPLFPILSTAVLRSAWVEPDAMVRGIMWQPLLAFLKEYPRAWDVEAAFTLDKINDEGSDSQESDVDDAHDARLQEQSPSADSRSQSTAYQEFLQFLQLGCSGSPLQGYPTVVIILSTMSSSTIASSPSSHPLTDFFTSFWAAIDGRALSALERAATSAAFLSSLLECTVFLIKRLRSDSSNAALLLGAQVESIDPDDLAKASKRLVVEQFVQIWEGLTSRRLRTEETVAGTLMAQALISLHELDADLFRSAWESLASLIKDQIDMTATTTPTLTSVVLKVFDDVFQDGTEAKASARSLISEILQSMVVKCEKALDIEDSDDAIVKKLLPLSSMLETFGQTLFYDAYFATLIDEMIKHNAYRLLIVSPALPLAYLSHRKDEKRCCQLWYTLLTEVSQHPEAVKSAFLPLLEAAQNGLLPAYLKPEAEEMDKFIGKLLADALGNSTGGAQLLLMRQVMRTADYFLSQESLRALLQSLISAFTLQVDRALYDSTILLVSFEASLDLLRTAVECQPQAVSSSEAILSALPDVFILGFLLPRCYGLENNHSLLIAQKLWTEWFPQSSVDLRTSVFGKIKEKLRSLLADSQVWPRPEDVLGTVVSGCPDLHVQLIEDLFPSRSELDNMLDNLSPYPIDDSLAVLEPLIPPASAFKGRNDPALVCDTQGYSSYARVVSALLQVFVEDRQSAKENLWALRHFQALALYASDFLRIPSTRSPVFEQQVPKAGLQDLISKTQQVTTYLLTSSADEGWRLQVVTAVSNDRSNATIEGLPKFLTELIMRAKEMDTVRESRILHTILQHVLDNADKDEADQWVMIARKIEKTALQTSMAIILAVIDSAPEPPRLDRLRNELAAGILGIPANKANTDGLLLLRRLALTAPDPGSDTVFLPQLRAVNILKACQQWIKSDVDMDEETEGAMTLVFFHLAPILQSVLGAHWDLIFDVIENNLENCTFTDDTTLVTLARTLRLILLIQDLVSTNKSLRAEWQERRMPILTLVRNLVMERLDAAGSSAPRSTCRELALSIVQDLPVSLIDQTTLPKMCHLLTDSSINVQKMAYQLSHEAAKKRTEYFVVEAGVDTEATVKCDLPLELLEILQRNLNDGDGSGEDEQELFGYLLSWMTLFDLFTNVSLKVRSSYVDQLRNIDIIAMHFIPSVFNLLNLYEGVVGAFKLDIWAIDEYYVQLYESGTSLQLLAAHLYYRALLTLPSLIRTWVLNCKDRQLYSSVVSYTSLHFSPVIIRTELAHVKSPQSQAELAGDNLTIKVANSVNEVTASYLVDDHQLEITLKMPSDWPLHTIEIKDLKKVGVLENRWRAWVLGVQQTIWSQNGRLVDGLSLFKKNVTLHFEGQVECAICYSIISVTDGSLPRKPCKTCKNRFHSACLYKWFTTSNSSSCPLCRSDIF